jgi:cell wall assembly regulator SMI1
MKHWLQEIERAYERYCQKRFPLPSAEDIQRLEDRINVTFPDDFREYLLQYNGGWFRTPVLDASRRRLRPLNRCAQQASVRRGGA